MTPITRTEALLDGEDLTPITRKEAFIKHIYDSTQEVPTPITREEWFLNQVAENQTDIEALTVTENGTYSEDGKAYTPVTVNVTCSTGTKTITSNGTYNASDDGYDGYSSVEVALPLDAKTITANGTYTATDDDLQGYSSVTVAVEGYTTATASGNPLTLTDAVELPLLECKAEITATQDLNGYDKPWAGGAGNNLCELFNDGKVPSVSNGALVTASGLRSDYIAVDASTAYTFSVASTVTALYIFYYDSEYTYISNTQASNQTVLSATTPSNTAYIMLRTDTSATNAMFNIGSTALDYEPYSNICPISGTSSVTLTHNDDTLTQALSDTCYGGSFDFASGESIDNKTCYTITGEETTWRALGSGFGFRLPMGASGYATSATSSHYTRSANIAWNLIGEGEFGIADNYIGIIDTEHFTTIAEAQSYFANLETPCQILYPLATSTTTQLSAHQVVMEGSDTLSVDTTNLDIIYFKEV